MPALVFLKKLRRQSFEVAADPRPSQLSGGKSAVSKSKKFLKKTFSDFRSISPAMFLISVIRKHLSHDEYKFYAMQRPFYAKSDNYCFKCYQILGSGLCKIKTPELQ